MYEYLFSKLLFPVKENLISKRKTPQYYQEYLQNQTLRLEQLQAIQWRKLTALLQHCQENVPFYQQQWQEIDVNWQDIKNLQDFAQLPVLTKDIIREHYQELIAQNYRGKTLSKATGGSTGVPLKFEFSSESVQRRTAVAMRGYAWAGLPPGRRSVHLWGTDFGTGRLQQLKVTLYQAFHGRTILNSFMMNESNIAEYVKTINKVKPRAIVAFVSPLVTMAEYILANNLTVWQADSIITGAEPIHDFQREIIEKAFRCPVFNTYGCREFMLIASECQQHQGMHINIDQLVVEITENGQPCANGESGNMTVTDLHNYGMPFIRYENGDMGRLSDSPCACGMAFPMLESLEGRKLDMIHTPDGRALPGEFFPHLIKDYSGVKRFQVIQDTLQELTVKLIVNEQFDEQQKQALYQIIKEHVGDEINLILQEVDDIPLTGSGKFRVTISRLPQ